MRVTTRMLTQSLINNVNANLQELEKYQKQLSSGTKISKPSDDPIATGQLLTAQSALREQEQFNRNMEYASGLLDTVDGALGEANDVLQRIRELAVSASSDTMPDSSMTAIADEVDTLIAELVQIGNTNYAGIYIFSGGKSTQTPFSISSQDSESRITGVQFISPTFSQSLLDTTLQKKVEIAPGVTVDIAAGRTAFHTKSDGNDGLNAIFEELITLREAIDNGEQDIVGGKLDELDSILNNILSERAVVGAKINRMESALSRSSNYQESLISLISKLGDTDYAEASTGFSTQQTMYEASLAVGAKIIQPSLIDFLK